MLNNLLSYEFSGNSLSSYCWFLGIILTGLIFRKLLSRWLTRFVFRFLEKYARGVSVDKLMELLDKPLGFFILLVTGYVAFDRLDFPSYWNLVPIEQFGLKMIIYRGYNVLLLFTITWIILRMVDFFGLVILYRASLTASKSDDQLVPFLKESIKIVIAVFSFFFILGAVFHVNIASLIAGLGIGGLAVALAAKESLENLLGSFTIFLDKPFVIGDFVQIGNITGHVEKIGFRSTRIRTVEKSYVTVPNKKMVEAELDNLSQRTHRRAKFVLLFDCNSDVTNIKKLVAELKSYLDANHLLEKTENRVALYEVGTSAIHVSVEYYVYSPKIDVYMAEREIINYKILELAKANYCEFVVPALPAVGK